MRGKGGANEAITCTLGVVIQVVVLRETSGLVDKANRESHDARVREEGLEIEALGFQAESVTFRSKAGAT